MTSNPILFPMLCLACACAGTTAAECLPSQEVYVRVDADGDGFGTDPIGFVCTPGAGQADHPGDCDDTDPQIRPGADEVCDLVDNDCDGVVDEDFPTLPFFADTDGDGFGSGDQRMDACTSPGPRWSEVSGDCDDADAAVFPGATEICNGGIDDDCDDQIDDLDPSLDRDSLLSWYPDADGDGWGDPAGHTLRCTPPDDAYIADASDCDDQRSDVFPGAVESCDLVDNDCDTLVDDDDPDVDMSEQQLLYADVDGDGFGHETTQLLACRPTSGLASDNNWDCDDSDPWATTVQHWYADGDADGSGVGEPLATQCLNPGQGLAPARHGVDCDDDDDGRSPITPEVCDDDIDQDCDTWDQPCFVTCSEALADDPSAPSGLYRLDTGVEPHTLYCDMATDGGGWMLVSSSTEPPRDEAIETRFDDLHTLQPSGANLGVYDGLRGIVGLDSDIRFSCTDDASQPGMTVDLSFYDIHWYHEITTGTDADSCFSELNGMGADPEPARRDNLTGVVLKALDPWNNGPLVGEDTCSDTTDFVVDFDDNGAGSTPDPTEWGEDDGTPQCGSTLPGDDAAWFIWVR